MHLQDRTRPDIDEIQSTIQIAINNLEKAYILIDGFDECTDTDRRRIFTESIKSLLEKSNSKLSVLITSRLENQLYKGISIKIEATQDEITSIVTKRMLAYQLFRKSLTDQVMEDPDLQKEIIEKIVSKAKGMFLIAGLYTKSLSPMTNIRDLREALDKLPDTLDQYYEDEWARIMSQNQHSQLVARHTLSSHGDSSRLTNFAALLQSDLETRHSTLTV
ncbi:MAG: hypothetical protein Q9188_002416 [Gyalolechia gomerana]